MPVIGLSFYVSVKRESRARKAPIKKAYSNNAFLRKVRELEADSLLPAALKDR